MASVDHESPLNAPVAPRKDARNLYNWFRNEIDVISWTQETIRHLLKDVSYSNDRGDWKVESATVTGDSCIVVNRSVFKEMFFLDIHVNFAGTYKPEQGIKGVINITNYCDENREGPLDEVYVRLDEGRECRDACSFVQETCISLLTERLREFSKLIKEKTNEHSLRAQKEMSEDGENDSQKECQKMKTSISVSSPIYDGESNGIRILREFHFPPSKMYELFTSQQCVQMLTRASAEINLTIGGSFTLLNGSITGTFVELVPEKKIVQKLKFGNWSEDSLVTITFEPSPESAGNTRVIFVQTGAPASEIGEMEDRWENIFFKPIDQLMTFH